MVDLKALGGFGRARNRDRRRYDDLRTLVMQLGRDDFNRRHPKVTFGPVLVLIASYKEADNIGPVLKAVPHEVGDLAVSTLVVVDGGDDGTEDIVADAGAYSPRSPSTWARAWPFGSDTSWPPTWRQVRGHGGRRRTKRPVGDS